MNILMAVDNSEYSQRAVRSLAARQWPERTRFKIISVIRPLSFFPTLLAQSNPRISEIRKAIYDSARLSVDNAANLLREAFGTSPVSCEIVEGHIAATIVKHARNWAADLIVLGSHGYNAMQELLLGSVSRDVAFHAPCSVEIVRKSQAVLPEFKNVLVPVDDSEYSAAALKFIAKCEWTGKCALNLISVIPAFPDAYELGSWNTLNLMKEQEKAAQVLATFLQQKSRELKKALPGVKVTTAVLSGDVRKQILDEARRSEADLVIMGSHGHGRIKGFLLGSVSQAVLMHCSQSVQIVKDDGNNE